MTWGLGELILGFLAWYAAVIAAAVGIRVVAIGAERRRARRKLAGLDSQVVVTGAEAAHPSNQASGVDREARLLRIARIHAVAVRAAVVAGPRLKIRDFHDRRIHTGIVAQGVALGAGSATSGDVAELAARATVHGRAGSWGIIDGDAYARESGPGRGGLQPRLLDRFARAVRASALVSPDRRAIPSPDAVGSRAGSRSAQHQRGRDRSLTEFLLPYDLASRPAAAAAPGLGSGDATAATSEIGGGLRVESAPERARPERGTSASTFATEDTRGRDATRT